MTKPPTPRAVWTDPHAEPGVTVVRRAAALGRPLPATVALMLAALGALMMKRRER